MNYLVVGAGLFGSVCAYEMAKRGNHVTVRSCLRSLLTSKQDPYKGHSNHDFTGI
ncbi:NAD(P)-binding protein [Lactiplantibacillus plantarum]|nr:NAD(P)-binding protein [Lactiplantibacillus plantarum]MBO2705959.1 NAD(P)-binding protein [Lactiplantibacillus plantarum]